MATFLRVPQRTILRMAEKGVLPAVKTSEEWRFQRAITDDCVIGSMGGAEEEELVSVILTQKKESS